jgi:hypothetical protein
MPAPAQDNAHQSNGEKMSDKDEFDIDIEETGDEVFDDSGFEDDVEGQAASEEDAAEKKKSGGKLLIGAVALAVLGGGAFAGLQFLGGGQAEQAPLQQQAAVAGNTAAAPAAQADPYAYADNFAGVAGVPQGIPPQPAEPPATIQAPWGAEDETPSAGAEAVKRISPGFLDDDAPAAAAGDGNNDNIVDPFALFGQTQAQASGTGASEEKKPDTAVIDPFSAGITEETVPADTTGAADFASPAETAVANGQHMTAAQVATLEQHLRETRKALDDAEAALAQANSELAGKSEELVRLQAELKAARKAAAEAVARPSAREGVKSVSGNRTSPPRSQQVPVRRTEWVLRSAKPGMAWVSEKGSREMRTIAVGDTLAGIGKVTAITMDAQGRWSVNGTQGTINQ